MQSSQACKNRTRNQQGAQAAKETNTCSPEGAHDSKHGRQTGRIHVAMQSVHAVKPSLQEGRKKPARASMQPRKSIHAAREAHVNPKHEKQTGRIHAAMHSAQRTCSQAKSGRSAEEASKGVHAAKRTNICSLAGAH